MVLSVGEILVDVFVDGQKKTVLPGGAPFNVACNIKGYGGDAFFYGAVGEDSYGSFLSEAIAKRLNSYCLDVKKECPTTQALVTLTDGERSFRFLRENGADYQLDLETVQGLDWSRFRMVHIGSLMLSSPKGRRFCLDLARLAHEKGVMVSFDVNYRDDIFDSEEEAKAAFVSPIQEADVLKFTEEELSLLSGQSDILEALKRLLRSEQIAVVTLGADGSLFYGQGRFLKVPSFPLKPVDTTGAGDAFYSYFLHRLDQGLNLQEESQIVEALTYANIAGGLATQKMGAIDAAPSQEEILAFYQKHKR